jgi:Xaa-Pro aminopeptidase
MLTRDAVLEKVERAMAERQLDALIAASPWNVKYCAGTSFFTQRTLPERLGIVAMTRGNEPVFIYCTIEEGHAKGESWLRAFRGYTEFAERPIAVLAEVLRERGVERGRIGIEKRFLVTKNYEELRQALPEAEIADADPLFDRMRAIKTPDEIAWLGQIARWTDEAIGDAWEQARTGESEREIGERMIAGTRERGATGVVHLVLATGPNAHKAHAEPGETRLEPGGVLRTDFGVLWGSYISDLARTAFVHPARKKQIDTYKALEEAHQATIAAIVPGALASDIYAVCRAACERRGLTFTMPHVGHSIGLGVHEQPMLHPYDQTRLEPGMMLMLEPLVIADDGLYAVEDLIEVTEQGPHIHSRSRDWGEPLIIDNPG